MTMATSASNLIFNLFPENEKAEAVVSHFRNAPFKHTNTDDGKVSLGVGIEHNPKNRGQLISFGDDPACCDIFLPDSCARQCHFLFHPRTCEVLLHDDSNDSSTALLLPHFPEAQQFSLPDAQHRQRVLLAGHHDALICISDACFRLAWSETRNRALIEAQRMRKFAPVSTQLDPLENGRITHAPLEILGEGGSAMVLLTLNLKTGDYLAVKVYNSRHRVERAIKDGVRKEVNLIASLHHVCHQPSRHQYHSILQWPSLICLWAVSHT
jgi:hypothetical protein